MDSEHGYSQVTAIVLVDGGFLNTGKKRIMSVYNKTTLPLNDPTIQFYNNGRRADSSSFFTTFDSATHGNKKPDFIICASKDEVPSEEGGVSYFLGRVKADSDWIHEKFEALVSPVIVQKK